METKSIHIQSLLYYSSDMFERFLASILTLDASDTKIYFHLTDQSENPTEYNKIKQILQNTRNQDPMISIDLNKQPNYGFGKGHNESYRKNANNYENFFIIINPDSILHYDLIQNINKYIYALQDETWGLLELAQFPSEHPKYYNPKTLETNWVSGAGLIIKKAAFEDVGMFDENIFMYGEDVDLSMRMRMKSYKIMHLPEAKFTHLTKDTDVSEESEFTRIHKQAAELYLRYKFAKDRDVKKYLSLIGDKDPHFNEIVEKFEQMKSSLNKRTPYRHFVDHNQDYTNFRWVL